MPDKDGMRIGAIILAGGRSERMGRPKESLPFHGDTLLGHTVATLRACAAPIVVVAREPSQTLPPLPDDVARIDDEQPGQGPLAGLAAGLRWLRGQRGLADQDPAFVTACDQPFLTAAAVRWLHEQLGPHRLVMPRVGGFLQPLCAIYRLSVLPFAERLLATGKVTPRSLAAAENARVLDEDELRAFDPSLRFLHNVNTPDDYRRATEHP